MTHVGQEFLFEAGRFDGCVAGFHQLVLQLYLISNVLRRALQLNWSIIGEYDLYINVMVAHRSVPPDDAMLVRAALPVLQNLSDCSGNEFAVVRVNQA